MDIRTQARPADTARATRLNAREEMVAAARACFERNGVAKTTMTDVATEAGATRQLVYRLFLNRQELVESAISARVAEIADDITESYPATDVHFTDAFVDLSVRVIEQLRGDEELHCLTASGSPVGLAEALWSDFLSERREQFWRPLLASAQARGAIRSDLSTTELADWLNTVYLAMVLRPQLDPAEERALIERFVVTSISLVAPPRPIGDSLG